MKVLVKSKCCEANVSPNAIEKAIMCQKCGANLGSNPYDPEKMTITPIKEEDTWDYQPKFDDAK